MRSPTSVSFVYGISFFLIRPPVSNAIGKMNIKGGWKAKCQSHLTAMRV